MSGTEQVLYANVIVDISHEKLDKIFQYRVPDVLRMQIHPGTAVTVPFGNGNRRIQGYVVKLTDRTDYPPEKIKEIQGVCAGQTGVEGKLIALAAWMRDYYGSTMIQALKAVLPVKQKVAQKEQKQIRLLLPEKEAREMLQVLEKKNQKARARLLDALLVIAKQNEKGISFLGAGKGAVWRYHASCTGNGRKGYRKAGKHADLPRTAGSDDLPVQSKAGRGKNADRQRLFSERRTAAGSPNDFKRVGSER